MRAVWLILAGCGRFGFFPDDGAVVGTGDPCVTSADTVALYAFDRSGPASDDTGAHSGALRGSTSSSAGPCGDALVLPGTSYMLVPDSGAFDLDSGSIDFFVKATATPASTQALMSRDAKGTALDGHLLISLGTQGHISARLQRRNEISVYRCADFVPSSSWIHVGVSFGAGAERGFRMWIDHVEATLPEIDDFPFIGRVTCGQPHGWGMGGNDNPFVIGGSNYNAVEGSPDPAVGHLFAGELDQVRISSIWRDFSRP